MRTLTETEMDIAAGGVDPIPVPTPETLPQPDPEWYFLVMPDLYPPSNLI